MALRGRLSTTMFVEKQTRITVILDGRIQKTTQKIKHMIKPIQTVYCC